MNIKGRYSFFFIRIINLILFFDKFCFDVYCLRFSRSSISQLIKVLIIAYNVIFILIYSAR